MAERVQAVRIRLSDGKVGLFWGPPIAEWPHAPGLSVVDVEFEAPRFVGGIQPAAQPAPAPAQEGGR